MTKKRKSGVLMPVSALPNRHGVGSFGKMAKEFLDRLHQGGFKLWQILPLNPLGYGHSPYQPFSSFAMDELYIDLDLLAAQWLIKKVPSFHATSPKVEYEAVRAFKAPHLYKAYEQAMKENPRALEAFKRSQPWVKDYALFMVLKKKNEQVAWNRWPIEDRDRLGQPASFSPEEKKAIDYEIWLQKTLYEQWGELHAYAKSLGIKIIGDVPFYVGYDSCDVWSHRDCFLLNPETLEPDWIAGVPPDYFSATGQRWGNPIYDWDHLKETHFAFLSHRIRRNAKIYDILRLDHFRAFDTYWKIPASCPTAAEGSWVEAPGYEFFDLILKDVALEQIIAEDLGDLRPEVLKLRDHFKFPGMNVIEFTFESDEIDHPIPKKDEPKNQIVYLGTHDNDTFKGFYQKLSSPKKREWMKTVHKLGYLSKDPNEAFYEYALGKKADTAIIAMQDILSLDSQARLNTPGQIDDVNWTWRMTSLKKFEDKLSHLKELNEKYGR